MVFIYIVVIVAHHDTIFKIGQVCLWDIKSPAVYCEALQQVH